MSPRLDGAITSPASPTLPHPAFAFCRGSRSAAHASPPPPMWVVTPATPEFQYMGVESDAASDRVGASIESASLNNRLRQLYARSTKTTQEGTPRITRSAPPLAIQQPQLGNQPQHRHHNHHFPASDMYEGSFSGNRGIECAHYPFPAQGLDSSVHSYHSVGSSSVSSIETSWSTPTAVACNQATFSVREDQTRREAQFRSLFQVLMRLLKRGGENLLLQFCARLADEYYAQPTLSNEDFKCLKGCIQQAVGPSYWKQARATWKSERKTHSPQQKQGCSSSANEFGSDSLEHKRSGPSPISAASRKISDEELLDVEPMSLDDPAAQDTSVLSAISCDGDESVVSDMDADEELIDLEPLSLSSKPPPSFSPDDVACLGSVCNKSPSKRKQAPPELHFLHPQSLAQQGSPSRYQNRHFGPYSTQRKPRNMLMYKSPKSLGETLEQRQRQKRAFWLVLRILMKHLEHVDKPLYQQARACMDDCARRNRRKECGYKSLIGSVRTRLQDLVGMPTWTRAETYLSRIQAMQQQQRTRQRWAMIMAKHQRRRRMEQEFEQGLHFEPPTDPFVEPPDAMIPPAHEPPASFPAPVEPSGMVDAMDDAPLSPYAY